MTYLFKIQYFLLSMMLDFTAFSNNKQNTRKRQKASDIHFEASLSMIAHSGSKASCFEPRIFKLSYVQPTQPQTTFLSISNDPSAPILARLHFLCQPLSVHFSAGISVACHFFFKIVSARVRSINVLENVIWIVHKLLANVLGCSPKDHSQHGLLKIISITYTTLSEMYCVVQGRPMYPSESRSVYIPSELLKCHNHIHLPQQRV